MKRLYTAVFLAVCAIIVTSGSVHTAYAAPVCTTLTVGLGLGSSNLSVILLQNFLRDQGYFTNQSTGYFGPVTFKAVAAFQTAQGLPAVGSVGPLTRAAIQKVSCAPAAATIPVASSTPVVSAASQSAAVVMATPAAPVQITLPYNPNNFSGWTGTWGDATTTPEGALLINANASTTGAEAILPASNNWTDYRYTANVTVQNGDITLIGRYTDDSNFVSCTFSNNWVDAQERVNGVTTDLGSVTLTDMSASPVVMRATSVAMRVQGNKVGCSASGPDDNVTGTISSGTLAKGGIGAETWFNGLGAATLTLESVQVAAL